MRQLFLVERTFYGKGGEAHKAYHVRRVLHNRWFRRHDERVYALPSLEVLKFFDLPATVSAADADGLGLNEEGAAGRARSGGE